MQTALVLGAGMVGSLIARDLATVAPVFTVVAADARQPALDKLQQAPGGGTVTTRCIDLADPSAVAELVRHTKPAVVCGAVSSHIAFRVLEAVTSTGVLYSDISFMGEDADRLDAHAKAHRATAVVDIGVAPGMSHALAADGHRRLTQAGDRTEKLTIYVGGLPVERRWPFWYKAAFSPADVLEEYTRPSRIVEHHQVVTRPALSEPELLDFPGVGTLEAFNTDGLRSLSRTYLNTVPHMVEKTLRYPGHIDLMRALRQTGLMSTEPVTVGGVSVAPRDLLAQLMFPQWQYQPGEQDLTVMAVTAQAASGRLIRWDVLDTGTQGGPGLAGETSMARTTAFPCAVTARLLADGSIAAAGLGPGIVNPERLGEHPALIDRLIQEQAARGVNYRLTA